MILTMIDKCTECGRTWDMYGWRIKPAKDGNYEIEDFICDRCNKKNDKKMKIVVQDEDGKNEKIFYNVEQIDMRNVIMVGNHVLIYKSGYRPMIRNDVLIFYRV